MNDQEIIEALNRAAREPPGPPRTVAKEDFDAIRRLVEQQPRIVDPRLVTMSDLVEKDQAFNFDPKENPPLTDEEVLALYRYYRDMANLLTWEPNMAIATDYAVQRAQNFISIAQARGLGAQLKDV